jgi:hypothetical protein
MIGLRYSVTGICRISRPLETILYGCLQCLVSGHRFALGITWHQRTSMEGRRA